MFSTSMATAHFSSSPWTWGTWMCVTTASQSWHVPRYDPDTNHINTQPRPHPHNPDPTHINTQPRPHPPQHTTQTPPTSTHNLIGRLEVTPWLSVPLNPHRVLCVASSPFHLGLDGPSARLRGLDNPCYITAESVTWLCSVCVSVCVFVCGWVSEWVTRVSVFTSEHMSTLSFPMLLEQR